MCWPAQCCPCLPQCQHDQAGRNPPATSLDHLLQHSQGPNHWLQAMRDRAALLETEMAERARAKGKMRNGYSQQPHQIYNSSSQNVFSDANSKQHIQAEETIEGKSDLPQVHTRTHAPAYARELPMLP